MPSLTPEQVREWAGQWLKGTLPAKERQLFEEWYRQQPPGSIPWTTDSDETSLKERLFTNITTQLDLPTPRRSHRIPFLRYSAAAAAILIILFGAYLWTKPKTVLPVGAGPLAPRGIIASRPGSDLLPGADKATLTLGNGSIITLDSTTTGALAQQGRIHITNLPTGELIYDSPSGTNTLEYNTIATARGGQYRLRLSDGTAVWLNASSSLRFPTAFSGDIRTVELKGEAYFEVAKNTAAPFHVKLNGDNDIEVLGTGFNVNAYDDESLIRTTLVDGAVRVRNAYSAVILRPGQQAQQNNRSPIRVKEDAAVREAVAWKDNLFYFKSADIHSIMRQLSRWYDVEVEYREASPAGNAVSPKPAANAAGEARFNAEIPRNTPAADILTALELTGKVKFTTINKLIIVNMN